MKRILSLLLCFLFIGVAYERSPRVIEAQTPDMVRSFSTIIGNSGEDTIRDIATDPSGNIYIAGGTASSTFLSSKNLTIATGHATDGFDTTQNGLMDAYILKMSPAGVLLAGTFFGGPNYDRAYALELDSTGVYIAGRIGTGVSHTAGALQPNHGGDNDQNALYGSEDGFIAKFSLDLTTRYWSTYFGGPGKDFIRDMRVDSSGDVYVGVSDYRQTAPPAGFTNNFPHITGGAYRTTPYGDYDGVVAKIHPASAGAGATSVVWCSYIGGTGVDGFNPSIALNSSNQLTYQSQTQSSNYPITSGAYQTTLPSDNQAMCLTRFNATGTALIWSTFIGGNGGEFSETHSLVVEPSTGDPISAFTTQSTNMATSAGAIQSTYGGGCPSGCLNYPGDAYIIKLNNTGTTRLAATYLGGSGGEGNEGVNVDSTGQIYISGSTYSTNFPTTTGAFQTTKGGQADMYAAKLSADLTTLIYSTYVGGANIDYGRNNIWDAVDDSFIVVGLVNGSGYPLLNQVQTSYGGGLYDAALIKFTLNAGATNVAPTCNAGINHTITLPATMALDGTAADDGLPNPPAALTYTWSKTAGPVGTVTFAPNANTLDVTASFPTNGTFTLQLQVSDGTLTCTDTMTATVNAAASNVAPTVNAGTDQTITLPSTSTLDATVTDDGLPSPPNAVTTLWTKVSGPTGGVVTFGNSALVDTTASFSVNGVYVLRLTANDSALSTSDDIQITVNAASSGGLPAGWLTADIGTVGVTGSASESGGAFTVAGAGRDICCREDAFRFLWQNAEYASGDEKIEGLVEDMGNTHPYAKAGAMVRQNLTPGSKFAMMAMTPSGAQFLARRTYGPNGLPGGSVVVFGRNTTVRTPYWTKVIRNGSDFSGWISPDGDTWTQVGSTVRINMTYDPTAQKGHCYAGMAVNSHNISSASTVMFDNVSSTFTLAGDWFYVSPTGSGSVVADNFAAPSSLKSICNGIGDVTAITDNGTIFLRGGTYKGRFDCLMSGSSGAPITMMSYMDEWAVIDGMVNTQLSADIDSTQTTFTVANGAIISTDTKVFKIDSEQFGGSANGNTLTVTRHMNGTTAAAHTAGTDVRPLAPVLQYRGNWTNFRDFEITVSDPTDRVTNSTTFTGFSRPTIFDNVGGNLNTYNLIAHEGGTSFTDQVGGNNSLHYGLINYNNGSAQVSGNAGHGIYWQSDTPKSFLEPIVFGNFVEGINGSGDVATDAPMTLNGAVMFGGSMSLRYSNDLNVDSLFINNNDTKLGPDPGSTSIGNLNVTNGYFVGSVPMTIGAFQHVTYSGNTSIGGGASTGNNVIFTVKSGGVAGEFSIGPNNKWYRRRGGLKTTLKWNNVDYYYNATQNGAGPFWQSLVGTTTNFDSDGVYSSQTVNHEDTAAFYHENTNIGTGVSPTVDTPGVFPFFRPNAYDANRAHFIAWDWDGNGNVVLNPTGWAVPGDFIEIDYGGNPLGDPVIPAFPYVSGNITISMAKVPIAPRVGYWIKSPDSLPGFGVWIVRKR